MKPLNVAEIVARIESILPKHRPIQLHSPHIGYREASTVQDCIYNDPVGYSHIELMQQKLRDLTGVNECLLVNSGTAALHLALVASGVKPGDEVLVPALTFVATANAVVHAGAIPNFIDGKFTINAYKLRCYLSRTTKASDCGAYRVNKATERPVRALVVVDLMGHPADYVGLQKVVNDFGLTLIEDAAGAIGSIHHEGKITPCGAFGQAAIFSFNSNKIVTTGGGGAVLTNDIWLLAKAYSLATTARKTHDWLVEHDEVAWNYRMPNICAAMGVAQLEQLSMFLMDKRHIAQKYAKAFDGCPNAMWWEPPKGANNWINTLLVDPEDRDPLLKALHVVGIKARAMFTPLNKLPMYKGNPQDNTGYAEDTAARAICLPSGFDI